MNSRDIVAAINDAMAKHLLSVMRERGNPMPEDAEEGFRKGAEVLDRLRPEFPTGPLPAPKSTKTNPVTVGHIAAIKFSLTMMTPTPESADKALDAMIRDFEEFKRAVREEALAEFTDGSNKADDMIGAVLKERGQ